MDMHRGRLNKNARDVYLLRTSKAFSESVGRISETGSKRATTLFDECIVEKIVSSAWLVFNTH